MARYRKIEVQMWGDKKFRSLSGLPPCGQGLWLYLLTNVNTSPIPGLFRAGRAAMAEELGWSIEAFDKAFQEVFRQGMVKADFDARVVWIPNAIKHNRPESPNVVISWSKEIDLIPECGLKDEAVITLYEYIQLIDFESEKPEKRSYSKAFERAFGKALSKPFEKAMPNQEQEQEQEQDQEQEENLLSGAEENPPQTDEPIFISLPLSGGKVFFDVPESYLREQAGLYPAVNIEQEFRNMRGWLDSNPERRKTGKGVRRFITTWLQRCQDSPKSPRPAQRDINAPSQPDNSIPFGFRG